MLPQITAFLSQFRLIAFICVASLTLVSGEIASAEYIPPGEVVIHTKAYQPTDVNFAKGTYEYSVRWEGLPVARAAIIVGSQYLDSVNYYSVTARAATAKFIGIFYKLRHESRSVFRADTLSPVEFTVDQTENSKRKGREVKFGSAGLISARVWKDKSKTAEETHDFQSENITFDPISAAFLARSLPVTIGEELKFDVFNGKHRFLIGLSVAGREIITVNGKKYDTFKVVPTVKKLTDTEGEKRLRSATLWVTADSRRDVIRVKSEVFVGSVTADFIQFVPDPVSDAGMVRASLSTPTTSEENSGETSSDSSTEQQEQSSR